MIRQSLSNTNENATVFFKKFLQTKPGLNNVLDLIWPNERPHHVSELTPEGREEELPA
jgi:hypothetical protein